jgi:hypothetical protein
LSVGATGREAFSPQRRQARKGSHRVQSLGVFLAFFAQHPERW